MKSLCGNAFCLHERNGLCTKQVLQHDSGGVCLNMTFPGVAEQADGEEAPRQDSRQEHL